MKVNKDSSDYELHETDCLCLNLASFWEGFTLMLLCILALSFCMELDIFFSLIYPLVHLVFIVENCEFCLWPCPTCSNYTNIWHCALVIMCALCCDVSGKHEVMPNSNISLLSFSCSGYDLLLTPQDKQRYI